MLDYYIHFLKKEESNLLTLYKTFYLLFYSWNSLNFMNKSNGAIT